MVLVGHTITHFPHVTSSYLTESSGKEQGFSVSHPSPPPPCVLKRSLLSHLKEG